MSEKIGDLMKSHLNCAQQENNSISRNESRLVILDSYHYSFSLFQQHVFANTGLRHLLLSKKYTGTMILRIGSDGS